MKDVIGKTSPKLCAVLLSLLLIHVISHITPFPKTPEKAHYDLAAQIENIINETEGEVLVFYRISFAFLIGRPVYWTDHSRLENQLRNKYFTRILIPQKAIDFWWSKQPANKILKENYYQESVIMGP